MSPFLSDLFLFKFREWEKNSQTHSIHGLSPCTHEFTLLCQGVCLPLSFHKVMKVNFNLNMFGVNLWPKYCYSCTKMNEFSEIPERHLKIPPYFRNFFKVFSNMTSPFEYQNTRVLERISISSLYIFINAYSVLWAVFDLKIIPSVDYMISAPGVPNEMQRDVTSCATFG